MPTDMTAARVIFDSYLASGDTTDAVISNTDKDELINEAYIEFVQRFGQQLEYSADFTTASNPFSLITGNFWAAGVASGPMPIVIETMEWKSGGQYLPLKRLEMRQVGILRGSEDATGNPTSYGMALVSRNLGFSGSATYRGRVYPRPTGSQTYRFLARMFPSEAVAGGANFAVDDQSSDAFIRIAAWKAGLTLGYSDEWAKNMLAPIEDKIRALMQIGANTRWNQEPGMERAITPLETPK